MTDALPRLPKLHSTAGSAWAATPQKMTLYGTTVEEERTNTNDHAAVKLLDCREASIKLVDNDPVMSYRPTDLPTDYFTNRPITRPTDCLTVRPTNQPIDRTIDRPTERTPQPIKACWLSSCIVPWFNWTTAGAPLCQATRHTYKRPISR